MQAPGAEWLVIRNDRQLWEGQIRQRHHAARSRRPEQRSRGQYGSLTLLGRLVRSVSRWTRIVAGARSRVRRCQSWSCSVCRPGLSSGRQSQRRGEAMPSTDINRTFTDVDRAADPALFVRHLDTARAAVTGLPYRTRKYELLQAEPGMRLLDAGCGAGTDLEPCWLHWSAQTVTFLGSTRVRPWWRRRASVPTWPGCPSSCSRATSTSSPVQKRASMRATPSACSITWKCPRRRWSNWYGHPARRPPGSCRAGF